MPIERGHDIQGPYYRWGSTGKKYHYTAKNSLSRTRAKNYALRQGRAIKAAQERASRRWN